MRTLIALCVILLFSLTAYGKSKPAPKLANITGYGQYKLGAPISQYNLTEFDGPYEDTLYSSDTWSCYNYYLYDTLLALGDIPVNVHITLFDVSGRLEVVRLTYMDVDTESSNFHDTGEFLSFLQELREALLDKYSRDLLVTDTLYLWDGSWNGDEYQRSLVFTDKDGDSLELSVLKAAVDNFTIEYKTALYIKIKANALQRLAKEYF